MFLLSITSNLTNTTYLLIPYFGFSSSQSNLSHSNLSLTSSHTAFNDIAEGFGLTLDEFQEIIRVTLKEYLGYSDKKMNSLAENVFHVFDDDENGLIDALEFLSAFALVSGMSVTEQVRYIFGIYDFDESGLLSVDEMTLALRSSISGLTKLSGIDPPLEVELEQLSVAAFDDVPSSGSEVRYDEEVRWSDSNVYFLPTLHN